ncbi:hypothetical protein Ddc_10170 [Ditylenchus destructor]|nr:hypothetical protein Ddc_10170 [Ditylenchus destructor]
MKTVFLFIVLVSIGVARCDHDKKLIQCWDDSDCPNGMICGWRAPAHVCAKLPDHCEKDSDCRPGWPYKCEFDPESGLKKCVKEKWQPGGK